VLVGCRDGASGGAVLFRRRRVAFAIVEVVRVAPGESGLGRLPTVEAAVSRRGARVERRARSAAPRRSAAGCTRRATPVPRAAAPAPGRPPPRGGGPPGPHRPPARRTCAGSGRAPAAGCSAGPAPSAGAGRTRPIAARDDIVPVEELELGFRDVLESEDGE